MSGDVARTFAREIRRVAGAPLPAAIEREAKRTLFNVFGLAVGAAGHPGVDAVLAAARHLAGEERVAVPGRAERTDAHFAALAAGFAAHVDDFDDTHLFTVIHPGASTLGVLVGLAPSLRTSGAAALTAFALGCEVQLRAGVAMSPEHYDRGWHITGTCGVIGTAAAAALLFGASEEELARALRLAASMPLGQRESFGTMAKAFHPGKAAGNGILAARLARAGRDAAAGVFEAPDGFGAALSARFDPAQMLEGFGKRWELAANTYKPYPCGIVAHPSIDAALALAARIGDPREVAAVRVRCHPLVPELMGNPDPKDGLEARFSAIHGVAAALCDGRVGLPQYETERVIRADARALRARTTLAAEPETARDEARIDVTLAGGTVVSEHVAHARGSLARPLTDAELDEKFTALVEPRLGAGSAQPLAAAVRDIGRATAFAEIVSRAVPQAVAHV